MATLKELMGDLKRGDGRRFFNLEKRIIFEPVFLDYYGDWHGLSSREISYSFCEVASNKWEVDERATYPKKIKIKLYSPIGKSQQGYIYLFGKYADKKEWFGEGGETIIGWHEIEVEVDE